MSKGDKSAVKVMVRVRPFNSREMGSGPESIPQSVVMGSAGTENITLLDATGHAKDTMEFHKVFWSIPEEQGQFCGKEFADQEDVYVETGKRAVATALSFKHCCIFAYGQTGSGKTYSMLGSPANPGISPRIVDELFHELDSQCWKVKGFEYTVDISFMEIYNERVKDLLSDEGPLEDLLTVGGSKPLGKRRLSSRKASRNSSMFRGTDNLDVRKAASGMSRTSSLEPSRSSMLFSDNAASASHNPADIKSREYRDLKVRNSPQVGVFVEGLKRLGPDQGIGTADDVKRVMKSGMEHRATAETQMNSTSSRSHAIFQLCIRARSESKGVSRYANINLVDLAGSERITLSGAEGARLVEATKINLSLSTLRRVIDVLIENSSKKGGPKLRPPFRDSTLTWILSESLGGNSVTMMLATVSPYEGNREDTVNTLRYAEKAKSIVNVVRVNEEKCNVLLSAMQREMENMRQRLQEKEEADPDTRLLRDLQEREEEMKRTEEERLATEQSIQENLRELQEAEEMAKKQQEEVQRLQQENVEQKKEKEVAHAKQVAEELEKRRQIAEARARRAQQERERLQVMQYERAELQKAKEALIHREELFRREVQLVKRKQFSLAFQKAFKKSATRSGTALLSNDLIHTNERVGHAAISTERISSESRQIAARNEVLHASIARVERNIKSVENRNADTLQRAHDQLSSLTAAKKADEQEVLAIRETVKAQRRHEHAMVQISMKENEALSTKSRQLEARERMVREGAAKKRELIKQLQEQIEVLAREVQILDRSCLETRETVDVTHRRRSDLRRKVLEEMEDGQNMRDDLIDIDRNTMKRRSELREVTDTAETLRAALGELSRKHLDLKKYVAHKYFPEGQMDATGADRNAAKMHVFDQNISDIPNASFDGNRAWVKAGYIYKRTSRSCSPGGRSPSPLSQRSLSPPFSRQSLSATPRTSSNSPLLRSPSASVQPRSLSPSRTALATTLLPC